MAAAIGRFSLQPDHASATQSWRHTADQLRPRWPKLGSLMGAVLLEANDEWQLQHRYMQAEDVIELASSPAETTTPLITPHAA